MVIIPLSSKQAAEAFFVTVPFSFSLLLAFNTPVCFSAQVPFPAVGGNAALAIFNFFEYGICTHFAAARLCFGQVFRFVDDKASFTCPLWRVNVCFIAR